MKHPGKDPALALQNALKGTFGAIGYDTLFASHAIGCLQKLGVHVADAVQNGQKANDSQEAKFIYSPASC